MRLLRDPLDVGVGEEPPHKQRVLRDLPELHEDVLDLLGPHALGDVRGRVPGLGLLLRRHCAPRIHGALVEIRLMTNNGRSKGTGRCNRRIVRRERGGEKVHTKGGQGVQS